MERTTCLELRPDRRPLCSLDWPSFSLDFVAIWPGWDRYVYHGKAVQLIYSTFGFLCALLWATAGAQVVVMVRWHHPLSSKRMSIAAGGASAAERHSWNGGRGYAHAPDVVHPSARRSLVAQRDHRIDADCAACGHVACRERDAGHQHDDSGKGDGIGRRQAIEQPCHEP
jgi:hypothetical protein